MPTESPRLPVWVALGGAALIGVMTAVQARVNGQLGVRLEDGLVAALISFGSGLLILTVASIALPAGRRGFVRLASGVRERRIPFWMLCGGAAGALTVATQGLAVGLIGVALFTVGIVAGQTVCGLVLDRLGAGPSGVVAITTGRVLGGVLALAAVAIALAGGAVDAPLWMLLLPFAAGVGIAWQQATNGRLRQRVGTPLTATLVNFIGGSLCLLVAAGVGVAVTGPPAALPTEPWLYVGGALGVCYIFLSAALVVHTGVLLLGLASVAGQLAASVALDLVWPAPAGPSVGTALTMAAVALASVVVAAVPWRRRRAR
ncbi:DMT family transporter [Microbacterium sp. zg.Y625]|uniref:DMT family transporter n=1 Tax=Microbacterium jiangjiandongii TaxID=3049071 RepID=UPI00214B11F9|nr:MULTISPECIES: DMT family transporter [unclassified Microbacterium]MCR2791738.1 DMT family transporter [Microbacterium sp. zg.Y625]WIM24555.1 DMT family transporter [Microbacterium sp. zg-Y625]